MFQIVVRKSVVDKSLKKKIGVESRNIFQPQIWTNMPGLISFFFRQLGFDDIVKK